MNNRHNIQRLKQAITLMGIIVTEWYD
jgi:hypothetical protein